MSRIANQPVEVPTGVEIKINGQNIRAKGAKGEMELNLHPAVKLMQKDATLTVQADDKNFMAMAGTMRSLLNNLVIGVSQGFERKLELVGVGYRVQSKGATLNLSLGFSHPVEYKVPKGISIETPSNTEILIKGFDKQKVGQVAAEIRAYRPPEPYKGKGIKYADERIIRKEAKKK